MTGTLKELGDHIAQSLPGAALKAELRLGELVVTVARNRIVPVLTFLPENLCFKL